MSFQYKQRNCQFWLCCSTTATTRPGHSGDTGMNLRKAPTPRTDWSDIRQKLRDFVGVYRDANYERGQAQPYWNALLRCFDVGEPVLKQAFEHRLKLGKKNNYVDAFIPGKLIVEHKGSHVDLGSAVEQLQGYYGLLPPSEQPRYAVLCNFQRLRLYDFSNLARAVVHECDIDDLPEKAELFKFLLPAEDSVGFLEQPGVDIKAARAVADLHGALTADGYGGRDLEVLLTRLIFCFFGDDTGIFGENTQVRRLRVCQRPAVFRVLPAAGFRRRAARRDPAMFVAELGQHQPGHLWQHVPGGAGNGPRGRQEVRRRTPRAGRALHQRAQHPAGAGAAVSG